MLDSHLMLLCWAGGTAWSGVLHGWGSASCLQDLQGSACTAARPQTWLWVHHNASQTMQRGPACRPVWVAGMPTSNSSVCCASSSPRPCPWKQARTRGPDSPRQQLPGWTTAPGPAARSALQAAWSQPSGPKSVSGLTAARPISCARGWQALRRESDSRALVLLDEVGTGTDPVEGAALGAAILQALARGGARGAALTFATTHHRWVPPGVVVAPCIDFCCSGS